MQSRGRLDPTGASAVPRRRRGLSALSLLVALALSGCRAGSSASDPGAAGAGGAPSGVWLVRGALGPDGEPVELAVDGTHFVDVASAGLTPTVIDLGGLHVVPAFIDSHVHLSYYPVADRLPPGGVVAAADFAAPLASLSLAYDIPVARSGPMITPPGGYPTRSWGSAGFGVEVASAAEAAAQVDALLDAGASFVKAPLLGADGLDDAALAAVAERVHARGKKLAVHALGAADATRAVASRADILAHTPVEPLPAEVVDAWGERAVVSTLAAFGGSSAAVDNLRAFAARGALVLYGTDLGNSREVGIQREEIEALMRAGLGGRAIVRAATVRAAELWGFAELGRLEPGRRASFLVLTEDPEQNPLTLIAPRAIVFDGRVIAGALP